ncbi:ectoine/hydroxyectoine ABC transporter substrate-binding protein EhuB [Virgibacillus soli]|uniref:Ectoine/hydroxyectoine ABC transporter substrate-binding protein EhuB n=1 Tax=Paracerasibacillus soli TaxID=480284 RepID=A0ABU5CVQ2_9BACI|nr:ectoine/hydroxyectoine ABC transporter substrate-binding protein EhuB [Virgibacillus soli]MDY0410401.1 ectoine/hydroxyectoine ABC transporter substrate-binding protein EhuB [Virgibacillus soli]
MRKLLITIVLGLSIILLAACNSEGDDQSLQKLKDAGKVTVGFANEKPYAYEDDDGELKGAAVDIAKAVFKELGIDEVEGKLSDFGQLVSGVNAKQFDVITAGMAIMPDRCENVAFGDPEMQYGEGLIVQAGNPLGLKSYEDIANNTDITVSVMEGATEIGFLKETGVDAAQIQSAPDIPATFAAVESGRADATTGTEATVRMALESLNSDKLEFVEDFEQPDVDGNPSYGAAAFHKDDNELREAYNEALKKLKEDGTVAEILDNNYFNGETNSVPSDITTEKICSGEIK